MNVFGSFENHTGRRERRDGPGAGFGVARILLFSGRGSGAFYAQ
jgi:hypothetical protein